MQTDSSQQSERLSGTIERVTFHSPESGFCVLRVTVRGQRDLVTVVGSAAAVHPGEFLESTGHWINDATYGRQFRAAELRIVPPSTLEGIEKYLASGMIRGIGPHFAKVLIETLGERVFEVFEREPERLRKLPGIGPKRQERILGAWAEQKAVREIMVFLRSYGIGTSRAVRIYRTYGEAAVERVRENPYRLALDIHGIGFKSADTLAQKIGIPSDSQMRAQAGVRHVLQEQAGAGHCAMPREALADAAVTLLESPPPIIQAAVDDEIREGNLIAEPIDTVDAVYLAALHDAETGVAAHLRRLLQGPPAWERIDAEKALPWVEERSRISFSTSQRAAFAAIMNSKVSVLTGGPGCGKTTLVKSVLFALRAKNVRFLLCAPTGRAAQRLAESTGYDARTIHRLLEFDPKFRGFKRNAGHRLDADLLVVDEVSMVDVVLMHQLLKAAPHACALLLVGDVHQLPSVGPGAVLADIIASRRVATVELTEIFRQAAQSRIIVNAHRIHQGRLPEYPPAGEPSDFYFLPASSPEAIHDKLIESVAERIPKRFGLDPIRDLQVLTPMNRGTLGTRALNSALQARLNATGAPVVERFGSRFTPGDKIIQMVNNYDKEVFNGDIGRITHVDLDEGVLRAGFNGREIEYDFGELDEIVLAYACSIHKSQGSEFPAVVVPLATQHYPMLERNLLYTAVTRGKRLVVVIGQPQALAIAVNTVKAARRLTGLAQRLSR